MTGQSIAYIRVSSEWQNTERQLDGMKFEQTFEEKITSKDTNRPQLQAMLAYVRRGDHVNVHSIDRFARNIVDLHALVKQITDKGAQITFHKEALTFKPGEVDHRDKLMLSIVGALAEFERSMTRERQREGIEIAKRKGIYRGRKPVLTEEQTKRAIERLEGGAIATRVATDLGVSRAALYAHLKRHREKSGK